MLAAQQMSLCASYSNLLPRRNCQQSGRPVKPGHPQPRCTTKDNLMEESKRKEILEKIRQIDDQNSPVAPQNAERLLSEVLSPLLEQDGYEVNYTGNTGRDHGVDFVANKLAVGDFPADTIGIEYKHSYAKAVGAETVHRILGASISAGFSRGMIVTNSRFTFAARESLGVRFDFLLFSPLLSPLKPHKPDSPSPEKKPGSAPVFPRTPSTIIAHAPASSTRQQPSAPANAFGSFARQGADQLRNRNGVLSSATNAS